MLSNTVLAVATSDLGTQNLSERTSGFFWISPQIFSTFSPENSELSSSRPALGLFFRELSPLMSLYPVSRVAGILAQNRRVDMNPAHEDDDLLVS